MKQQNKIQKFIQFLHKYDGVWALPLAFFGFVLLGYGLQMFGSGGVGTYDIGFFQPFFLACCIVIGASNCAVWGLYFTFRDLWFQVYKKTGREDFKNLTALQKTIISLVVFFLYVFLIIFVYQKLV